MTTDSMALADKLAHEIKTGKLKPGDRLPPLRNFAFEHGIAASTTSRIYTELQRRGLVVGEVGRGTFVAGQHRSNGTIGEEPQDGRINLEYNFPIVPEQSALVTKSISALQRVDMLDMALRPITQSKLESARVISAEFLSKKRWTVNPDSLVFTGSGKQSIAAAISATVPIGGRIGVEAVTYPLVKSIAANQGATVIPLAMDNEGVLPEAILEAHRANPLSAFYIQPVLQNPLGCSMSQTRRDDLIRLAEQLGIFIIEDFLYGFLTDDLPLAERAPDLCIVIDSMSKRIAPGLAVGFLHCPMSLRDKIASTVRSGAWNVSALALDIALRLMSDGTASLITQQKRKDAHLRQRIVAECLDAVQIQSDKRSYHVWLQLPEGWRSEAFVAAAARENIALTPSSAFAVTLGHAPNAVRLALGMPSHNELRNALTRLRRLLDAGPDYTYMTE